MTTVLITGANGFVGSHALEAVQARGEVTVIAACRDRRKLPAGFRGEVREGDLRDHNYLGTLLHGVDVVCHGAAWVSAWSHKEHSRRLLYEPTIRCIDAAIAAGVRRHIFPGTTSAAAPQHSADPMSHGIPRAFWPHLCNVIAIEEYLRERAGPGFEVINLRLGLFVGKRYGLGLLPLLLPRLKTHLVPWVAGGRTGMPIIDGEDIGQAFACAVTATGLNHYEAFNVVGPEIPSARQVLEFLHDEFGYPKPHFSVPFPAGYAFAWLMEMLDPLVPWEPLVTRSIIHLLEETGADNAKAQTLLGYRPRIPWRDGIRRQLAEMQLRQTRPMRMFRPV